MSAYDEWKTDDGAEEFPYAACESCKHEFQAEGWDDDGGGDFTRCAECGDVTCEDCIDDDTAECPSCVQRASERHHNALTTFAALSAMSRVVAQGGVS